MGTRRMGKRAREHDAVRIGTNIGTKTENGRGIMPCPFSVYMIRKGQIAVVPSEGLEPPTC